MKKKNSKVVVTLPGCSEQSLMRAHRTGWSTAASAAVVLPQLEIRPTAAAAVAMIAVAVVGADVVEHLVLVIVGAVVVVAAPQHLRVVVGLLSEKVVQGLKKEKLIYFTILSHAKITF